MYITSWNLLNLLIYKTNNICFWYLYDNIVLFRDINNLELYLIIDIPTEYITDLVSTKDGTKEN